MGGEQMVSGDGKDQKLVVETALDDITQFFQETQKQPWAIEFYMRSFPSRAAIAQRELTD
ncbi:hypothetical protein COLO4_06764 [Corchorus olitorius]|uniref:Uncharacterized protein n=1 Tax=Corchorus olitorius TaxID=93759 RepID=A0A1R3KM08_9ROSI|nr:hypothetical protein COLO4_06764 [Corchorus olitorius]